MGTPFAIPKTRSGNCKSSDGQDSKGPWGEIRNPENYHPYFPPPYKIAEGTNRLQVQYPDITDTNIVYLKKDYPDYKQVQNLKRSALPKGTNNISYINFFGLRKT